MPAFFYDHDEWWPVYGLAADNHFNVGPLEFTDADIADLRRVEAEFLAWQQKIAQRFGVEPPDASKYELIRA